MTVTRPQVGQARSEGHARHSETGTSRRRSSRARHYVAGGRLPVAARGGVARRRCRRGRAIQAARRPAANSYGRRYKTNDNIQYNSKKVS